MTDPTTLASTFNIPVDQAQKAATLANALPQNNPPVTPTGGSMVTSGQTDPAVTSSTTTPTTPTVATKPTVTDSYDEQKTNLTGQLNDVQTASQDALKKFNDTVTGMQNGSVPLTPYEQAQIDATKSSYDAVIKSQELANKNLIGGTAVLNQNKGLSRYAPEMAQGNIFAATTEANQKISELNTKMNLAVAQMKQGFQESNYKMVKDAYDATRSAQNDKKVAIENLYNKVQEQQKLAVQHSQDAVMSTIGSTLINPNLSIEERKKKVAELVASGNLTGAQIKEVQSSIENQDNKKMEWDKIKDESARGWATLKNTESLTKSTIQKNNLESAKLQQEIKDLKDANSMHGGIAGMGVSTNQFGTPNVTQQKQFLDTVAAKNPGLALQIKAAAEYQLDPKVFPIAKGARDNFDAMVRQYDPSYDSTNYAARQAYQKTLQSGTYSLAVNSANKTINHLTSLLDSMGNLSQTNFNTSNSLFNTISSKISPKFASKLSEAETESQGVAQEMEKFFKGTGVSDVAGIKDWKDKLSTNLSPGQVEGLKTGALNLFTGQLDTLYAQYKQNMGHTPPIGAILQPETLTKLDKLGVDITPYIQGTPMGLVRQIAQGGNPAQKQLVQKMVQDGKTDEDILQVLGE